MTATVKRPFDFAFQMFWQKEAETHPPQSWVVQSRRGLGYAKDREGLIGLTVDFIGPALKQLPPDAAVAAVVSTTDGKAMVAITSMITALIPKQAAATWPWRWVRSAVRTMVVTGPDITTTAAFAIALLATPRMVGQSFDRSTSVRTLFLNEREIPT